MALALDPSLPEPHAALGNSATIGRDRVLGQASLRLRCDPRFREAAKKQAIDDLRAAKLCGPGADRS